MCSIKTAFVMAHKIREAIGAGRANIILAGTVELDGAYFGGKSKEKNVKAVRKDPRLAEEQTGKRQSVVVARERDGQTSTTVAASEAAAGPCDQRPRCPERERPCRRSRWLGSPTHSL
jgi:hypothetical protein